MKSLIVLVVLLYACGASLHGSRGEAAQAVVDVTKPPAKGPDNAPVVILEFTDFQ